MSFLWLIAGFVLLIKGADILIDSAAKLAHLLAIPSFIIGFSVIAFGTSAPELAIGVFSGIRGANQITLGDVIGSCIANIALIIGVTALIHPLNIEKSVLFKDIPLSLAVQLLFTVLLLSDGRLSGIDAAILLTLFILFLFYIFRRSKEMVLLDEKAEVAEMDIKPVSENIRRRVAEAKTETESEPESESETEEIIKAAAEMDSTGATDIAEEEAESEEIIKAAAEMDSAGATDIAEAKEQSGIKLAGLILLSLLGIIGGGNLIVNSSTEIARMFGLSDVLIGITVVAIGTSLPELVTSVVAALKKQSDIAIGNIIGSNVFNVLFVLGTSALIHPIGSTEGIGRDILFMLVLTVLIFLIPLRSRRISKTGGILLLFLYIAFICYKVLTA